MTVVAMIPARGGSQRIPGKNLADCAGKPLLAWTAEAALASGRLDRIIVSTEDEAIAAAARRLGLEAPFLRPSDLAGDTTPMLPVVQHFLDWLDQDGEDVDALVLLQPTSPLRRAHHIDESIELFFASGAETVVSVVEVPHIYHPAVLHRIDDGALAPWDDRFAGAPTSAPRALARNGPAVLINRPEVWRRGEKFGRPLVGYEMSLSESVDIDEPVDLAVADALLRRRAA